jgi:hypothetical protein
MMLQLVENIEKKVFLLDDNQIDFYWPEIMRLLGEVPGYYDFFTPEWTYQKAKSHDIQVWGLSDGAIRGIIITQILCFPAQKCFEILGAAGNGLLDFLGEMEDVFDFIAADAGCSTMISRTRPGLEKLLRKHGAVKICSFLIRPIGKRSEH